MKDVRQFPVITGWASLFAAAGFKFAKPSGQRRRRYSTNFWHYGAKQARKDAAWLARNPLHPAHPNNAAR